MKAKNPYPALFWLHGKKACVVGGGGVALHRAEGLIDAGVDVVVIAPEICKELKKLVSENLVQWEPKRFSAALLQGVSFVVCATDDPDVNRQAAWAAKAMGAFVNMAAPPLELSDFTVPASVRRGDLLFSVSTGGACPELSHRLRGDLEHLCDIYAPWLERLLPIREEMKEKLSSSEERKAFWREALSEETMALVQKGKLNQAEELVRNAVGCSWTQS